MPESTRKRSENRERVPTCRHVPCAITIPQAKRRMTMVRIAVARFESTPLMPIFARIAVIAAKNADNKA
jgi:hypothetical protein